MWRASGLTGRTLDGLQRQQKLRPGSPYVDYYPIHVVM
jgi:hypothetical protein